MLTFIETAKRKLNKHTSVHLKSDKPLTTGHTRQSRNVIQ